MKKTLSLIIVLSIIISVLAVVPVTAATLTNLFDEQLTNADVNNDGIVNVFDATQIQRMIAGLA